MSRILITIKRYFNKHPWLTAFLIMAAATILYTRIPAVIAETNQEGLRTDYQNFLRGFGKTNFEYMRDAFYTFKVFTGAYGGDHVKFAGDVYRLSQGLGIIIIVFYSLYTFFSEVSKGDMNPALLLRVSCPWIAAIYIILVIGQLMGSVYTLGTYTVSFVDTVVAAKSGDYDIDGADEKKITEVLSMIPGLSGNEDGTDSLKDVIDPEYEAGHFAVQQVDEMIKYLELIVYLPMLLSIFLIGTAIFEIWIMKMFAPLAVASIAIDGIRSPGVRFIKRYFAAFLKIAIYFIIAAIGAELTHLYYGLVVNSHATEMTPGLAINITFMLLSNAMAAMAMMQSSGLSNEIVGV